MSRTILDLIIKQTHLEPQLINHPLLLKEKIEQGVGHKINFKAFSDKYSLLFKKENSDLTKSDTKLEKI